MKNRTLKLLPCYTLTASVFKQDWKKTYLMRSFRNKEHSRLFAKCFRLYSTEEIGQKVHGITQMTCEGKLSESEAGAGIVDTKKLNAQGRRIFHDRHRRRLGEATARNTYMSCLFHNGHERDALAAVSLEMQRRKKFELFQPHS